MSSKGATGTSISAHGEYRKSEATVVGRGFDGKGKDFRTTALECFGPTLDVIPTYSSDLDARHELAHTTTGLKYSLRGRARIIEQSIGRRLASFQDPIKAILPVTIVDAHRVIITTKEVVGGRSIIAPERAPARTVGVKESTREITLERYGGDLEMNLNLQHTPQVFKEELELKIDAQEKELERVLIELGYETLMTEGLQLPDAIQRSNPLYGEDIGDRERLALRMDANRIYIQNCFATLTKNPFPLQSILSAAKYATAYTIGAAGSVLILPHGVPEMLQYTKPERMTFAVSGLKTADNKPITMDLGTAHTDPATNIRMLVHIPMPTYEYGTGMPRVGMGCLSRVVTVLSFYMVPSTIGYCCTEDYAPMLGRGTVTGAPNRDALGDILVAYLDGLTDEAEITVRGSAVNRETRETVQKGDFNVGANVRTSTAGTLNDTTQTYEEVFAILLDRLEGTYRRMAHLCNTKGYTQLYSSGNRRGAHSTASPPSLYVEALMMEWNGSPGSLGDVSDMNGWSLPGMFPDVVESEGREVSWLKGPVEGEYTGDAVLNAIDLSPGSQKRFCTNAPGFIREGIDQIDERGTRRGNACITDPDYKGQLTSARRADVPWMTTSIVPAVTREEQSGTEGKLLVQLRKRGTARPLRSNHSVEEDDVPSTDIDPYCEGHDADALIGSSSVKTGSEDAKATLQHAPYSVANSSAPLQVKARLIAGLSSHNLTLNPYSDEYTRASTADLTTNMNDLSGIETFDPTTVKELVGVDCGRHTTLVNATSRSQDRIKSNNGSAQLVFRKTKVLMSSAILAAPGAATGELLVGMPHTGVSTSQTDETLKMQLRVYLGAVLKQPESVIILPDVAAEGIVGQSKYPTGDLERFKICDGKGGCPWKTNGSPEAFTNWMDESEIHEDFIMAPESILDMSPRVRALSGAEMGDEMTTAGMLAKQTHQQWGSAGGLREPGADVPGEVPGSCTDRSRPQRALISRLDPVEWMNPPVDAALLFGLPIKGKRESTVHFDNSMPHVCAVSRVQEETAHQECYATRSANKVLNREDGETCKYGEVPVMTIEGRKDNFNDSTAPQKMSLKRLYDEKVACITYMGTPIYRASHQITLHSNDTDDPGGVTTLFENTGHFGKLDDCLHPESIRGLSGTFAYNNGGKGPFTK